MTRAMSVVIAAAAGVPAVASAQWTDNFDSYATGSITGHGGWEAWNGPGTVTNSFSQSGPNSLQIGGSAEAVHQYAGYTSGQWSYSGEVYIPGTLSTGISAFAMFNDLDYCTVVEFNFATNRVTENLLGDPSPGSASIPLVRNAWVSFRVDIDLGADTQSIYYNNTLIMTTNWVRLSGGAVLGAVDLNANGAGPIYYDNLMISAPTPPCYANCDGSTASPTLNVADFSCFLQKYAAGDPYANCDGSTAAPILNVADFSCFLQRYAAGCR
jgi:hypothetical protein